MEQNYVAFISYRHMELDSAVAKALHTQIEQYVIPKELRKQGKKLGRVFRDLDMTCRKTVFSGRQSIRRSHWTMFGTIRTACVR